jgi:acetyl esterase/lipase
MLYFHGGGYAIGSPVSHRGLTGRLAEACAARVIVPDYRRAPEHAFPAAVLDAAEVWTAVVADGVAHERIVLGGDSCGGALALVLAMAARDAGQPAGAVFTFSAWTDLAERPAVADDPVLEPGSLSRLAAQYLDGASPTDWRASPSRGDVAGLPPVLMHVGEREFLRGSNRRLAEQIRAAGGLVDYEEWADMIHVFQMHASRLAEAGAAIDRVGAFVRRHVPPGT